MYECGRAVNESLFFRRDKNHHVAQTPQKIMWNEKWKKMKDKIIFAWEAEKKVCANRHEKFLCPVIFMKWLVLFIYNVEWCGQVALQRREKMKLKMKKKEAKKLCDVNTSQFIEQVFQFIFTRSSIWARCPGVRASSIRVEADDDVIQRATSHILEAPNWQPIWKILFTSCRRASDTMRFFGFFRSKRNWLFDLFITLFYWFLEMRVLSALNMMNVSSASWCMCNEPWACHECKFVTASTWFRWRLKNSNFIFRQRRRAHAWKIRTHIHAYWFIRLLLSALCSVLCALWDAHLEYSLAISQLKFCSNDERSVGNSGETFNFGFGGKRFERQWNILNANWNGLDSFVRAVLQQLFDQMRQLAFSFCETYSTLNPNRGRNSVRLLSIAICIEFCECSRAWLLAHSKDRIFHVGLWSIFECVYILNPSAK